MKNKKKLKVGIVVDDINQPYLVYDFYKKSLQSDYYTIVCLIIQKSHNLKNKNFIEKLINYTKTKGILGLIDRLIFEFIDMLETEIVKKKDKFKNLVFVLIFLSIILEILQLLVPNRSFEIYDLSANFIGVLFAFILVKIYKFLTNHE